MKGQVLKIFSGFFFNFYLWKEIIFNVEAEAFLVRSRGKFNYFQEIKS